jgi:hypothetical protein
MTTLPWIICERTTRWAAALRMAFSHPSRSLAYSTALHEVRSLPELSDQLTKHQNSMALIEVTPDNLEAALGWLAAATNREEHLTAVALLDYRRTDNSVRPLIGKDGQDCPSYSCDIVATALREAGATDVIHSPRQIRPVLALGDAHAAKCNVAASRCPAADQSFENWAWSLLPWQDTERPVG